MSKLQNFDIQAKGIIEISAQWQQDHKVLKDVIWPLEDVVKQFHAIFDLAFGVFNDFRNSDNSQSGLAGLAYFVTAFEAITLAATEIATEADAPRAQAFEVDGLSQLKANISMASEAIAEMEAILSEEAKKVMPSLEELDDIATEPDAKWLNDGSWQDYAR